MPNHALGKITVSNVEITADADGEPSLGALREHVQCDTIAIINCDERGPLREHCAILDEDGLYAENPGYTWCPQIGPQPYAGRILLMRMTPDGGTTDATIEPETVRDLPGLVYLLPHMAALFARRHEEAILASFPGIIMVPGSEIIQEQIAAHGQRQQAG